MVDRRLTWLAGFIVAWGCWILGNLISLQIVRHREYLGKAKARQEITIEIPSPRGTIFDRTGQPLAMSVSSQSVYVNPQKVPDLGFAGELLALVLGMDRDALTEKLRQASDEGRGFLWIKKRLSPAEVESLRSLSLEMDWIQIANESERHYPKGTVAAHVMGSVDSQENGNAGIEKYLNSELRGKPGRERMLTDVKRRGIASRISTPPQPGTQITLTIDERLQYVAEREIAAAVQAHNAKSGSVVVLDPSTGDVLAMASYPTYDPNLPVPKGQFPAERINHAIQLPFEPGSVFKVITLSAALETTSLRPESPINCLGGVIRVANRTIHDSHGGMGTVPMETVLAKSSNVGAIQVGMRVGVAHLYEYVRRFGFGQRTGIQLPAENPGKVWPLDTWGQVSLASVSIGQQVSVTTLQLAQAACTIANGGTLVKPRLVLKRGGDVQPLARPVKVLDAATAITMRQMMEGVVLNGTGAKAKLQGYSSGGKTGTAQIFDLATRHYSHNYNSSYMGFAPLTNPKVVVVVSVNGTHGEAGFGAYVAGPVFKAVAMEALRVFDVPKDVEIVAPVLVAEAVSTDDLAINDGPVGPHILEVSADDEDAPEAVAVGPRVPDFKGKTMRAVLMEAAAKGLTVLPDGSGIATVQFPAPGSALHQGERIRVQFAR